MQKGRVSGKTENPFPAAIPPDQIRNGFSGLIDKYFLIGQNDFIFFQLI